MPTYEYRCAKCGEELEVYQTFAETPLTKHKGCGGKLAKVLSPAGIVLKGSGFYKTDNRNSSKRSGSKESSGNGNGSGSANSDSGSSSGDSSSKSEYKSSDSGGGSGSSSSGDSKRSDSGSSSDSKKPAAKSA